MSVFKMISEIEYKEKKYYVLINRACQKYFIKKCEDNSIMYPTEDEFIELSNIFNKIDRDLAFLKFGKKYEIEPKVISKKGKLIALAAALLLTSGCNMNQLPQTHEFGEISIEESFKVSGCDFSPIEGYEDERIYALHVSNTINTGEKTIYCESSDEFAELSGAILRPSYGTVRQNLQLNTHISDKYKNWLLDGLDNMSRELPNLDLTVLNFNLQRLEIIEITEEEMQEIAPEMNFVGKFDPETGKVYFVKDKEEDLTKFILYHEVLGHGCTEAIVQRNINETLPDFPNYPLTKEIVWISNKTIAMQVIESDESEHIEYSLFGDGLEEGKADAIARIAIGIKHIVGLSYQEEYESLIIFLDTIGMSLEEFISNDGIIYLNKAMQANDVNDPLSYIIYTDVHCVSVQESSITQKSEGKTFISNITDFFTDYSDDKIKRGESPVKLAREFSKIVESDDLYLIQTYLEKEDIEEILTDDSKSNIQPEER